MKLIYQHTKIKCRKKHVCFVCKKVIDSGDQYMYQRIVDYNKTSVYDRRKHLDCDDPEKLEFLSRAEEHTEAWNSLKSILNRFY
jgi:hypothetical protein